MKERPIIMGAESVRAILDGRKTQTRRVIKPGRDQRKWLGADVLYKNVTRMTWDEDDVSAGVSLWVDEPFEGHIGYIKSPYGKPGDRLWVRETWYCDNPATAQDAMAYGTESVFYKASEADPGIFPTWKSPLFMPRWASRLTLEIVDIRAERLQSITVDDAIAEGMYDDGVARHCRWGHEGHLDYISGGDEHGLKCHTCRSSREHPVAAYRALWNSINNKHRDPRKNTPWKDDPWVWAVTFRKV